MFLQCGRREEGEKDSKLCETRNGIVKVNLIFVGLL
jgi:hypothetical protein